MRCNLVAMMMVLSLAVTPSSLGQRPRPRGPSRLPQPMFDPSVFLDSFFGEESETERERANQVPVSRNEEANVGQSALNALRSQLRQRRIKLLDRGDDVDYVRSLIAKLRPLMKNSKRYRQVNVYVADTDDTDARSFPGGTVVVFRGLIDYCENEAALVGILGHELSHFDRGHQLYHVKRWKLMQQSLQSGFDPRRFTEMGSMFARMFARPFRPEEESEADDDGVRWAFALGYDPTQMAQVFRRLAERRTNRADFMPSFLRSHPYHEDRYRAILKRAETLGRGASSGKRWYIGRKNLQQRTSRFVREFDDEFTK